MTKLIQNRIVIIVSRLIVGGILIYASFDKIEDPGMFARAINNYHLLPFGLENLMALILPWCELLVGVGLILGILLDGAAILSMGMMGMFIVAIGVTILRGYNIECGCGLKEGEMVGLGKIVEDGFYFILSWLVFKRDNKGLELFPRNS